MSSTCLAHSHSDVSTVRFAPTVLQRLVNRPNKAVTATLRRLAERFDCGHGLKRESRLHAKCLTIHVATTATLTRALERLAQESGERFVAMTNKDGVAAALLATADQPIGVMNAEGTIVALPRVGVRVT